jgi:hypothetical protein
MDHFGISTSGALTATMNWRCSGLNRSHLTRTKLHRRMALQPATQVRSRRRRRPIFSTVRLGDDATRLLAPWCISIRSKTFFRETFYSPNFDPLRKQPCVTDVTVLCGPSTNTRSSTAHGMTPAKWVESLIYFGAGRRHTFVTSSATAIPSDTSTKRW